MLLEVASLLNFLFLSPLNSLFLSEKERERDTWRDKKVTLMPRNKFANLGIKHAA